MSRAKYRNKKIEVGGIEFDSKKEAKRYSDLLTLLRAGEISDLQLQREFELIPAQYEAVPRYGKKGQRLKDGTRCIEKGCVYKADFSYMTRDGRLVVEDVKGYRNPNSAGYAKFVIKRKLMLWLHGIRIIEV
jgi:hypothetical protein